MADPYEEFEGSPFGAGARTPVGPGAEPARTPIIDWARDTGLDVVRGGLGIVRDITGAKSAISTGVPGAMDPALQRENLTALEDLDTRLKGLKSPSGQYREERPPSWSEAPIHNISGVLGGLAAYAPVAMTGPAAPPIF